MLRSDESDTALPQKERFRCVRCGQPKARTSVAVSERAQQNDYKAGQYTPGCFAFGLELTRSRSCSPLAALVRYTIALSVRYVQSARHNFLSLGNWNWPQC